MVNNNMSVKKKMMMTNYPYLEKGKLLNGNMNIYKNEKITKSYKPTPFNNENNNNNNNNNNINISSSSSSKVLYSHHSSMVRNHHNNVPHYISDTNSEKIVMNHIDNINNKDVLNTYGIDYLSEENNNKNRRSSIFNVNTNINRNNLKKKDITNVSNVSNMSILSNRSKKKFSCLVKNDLESEKGRGRSSVLLLSSEKKGGMEEIIWMINSEGMDFKNVSNAINFYSTTDDIGNYNNDDNNNDDDDNNNNDDDKNNNGEDENNNGEDKHNIDEDKHNNGEDKDLNKSRYNIDKNQYSDNYYDESYFNNYVESDFQRRQMMEKGGTYFFNNIYNNDMNNMTHKNEHLHEHLHKSILIKKKYNIDNYKKNDSEYLYFQNMIRNITKYNNEENDMNNLYENVMNLNDYCLNFTSENEYINEILNLSNEVNNNIQDIQQILYNKKKVVQDKRHMVNKEYELTCQKLKECESIFCDSNDEHGEKKLKVFYEIDEKKNLLKNTYEVKKMLLNKVQYKIDKLQEYTNAVKLKTMVMSKRYK
ncbi:hypothetical protein PFLG_01355 [Plasmodium falciparum RAJ116]|uniref:Uncharacterized protein n=1 Tax=Plasmodium falciparum RAJ116 TaxID=580058 RepID=A0A0L0CWN5_PLAFA|nr:hypothetical protein PFLG_01355 [Plasmodium falciparum RAJ116]